MAVCTKDYIARLDVTGFGHQLVADTIASVDVFHAVFGGKSVTGTEMSRIIDLAGRNHVVVDQNDLVGIPELCKSHLFKFFGNEGNKDIMDHHAVNICGNDVTGFDIGNTGIML